MVLEEQWFDLADVYFDERAEAEADAQYDALMQHLLTDHSAHVQEGRAHAWDQSCGHLVIAYSDSQAIPF